MKLEKNRQTAKLALEWCMDKWGKSKFHKDYPRLVVFKNHPEELSGWFNDEKNIIYINLKHQHSALELIKTVIHEYTHFKQNTLGKYDKLARKYKNKPYEEHPLEKQAFKREKKWGKICRKQIKQKLFS